MVLQIQLILTLGGMAATLKNSDFGSVISCLWKWPQWQGINNNSTTHLWSKCHTGHNVEHASISSGHKSFPSPTVLTFCDLHTFIVLYYTHHCSQNFGSFACVLVVKVKMCHGVWLMWWKIDAVLRENDSIWTVFIRLLSSKSAILHLTVPKTTGCIEFKNETQQF